MDNIKNNLFVCHSQAQLILAIGLVGTRFKEFNNHLILFKDFELTPELIKNINDAFGKVYYFKGTYPKNNKLWISKIYRFPREFILLKNIIKEQYENLFVVCDGNLHEIYILKLVNNNNKNVNNIWLEDGVYPYFLNVVDRDGFSSNRFMILARLIIFKYLMGFGKYYNFKGLFMGANVYIKQAYITHKGAERDIFNDKKIVEITKEEFFRGMKGLFKGVSIDAMIPSNSIVVLFDKLNVYTDFDRFEFLLKKVLDFSKISNKKIFFKMHPREERQLEILNEFCELSRHIGFEYYLSNFELEDVVFIGFFSTSLQSAKKMGYQTVSLINLYDRTNISIIDYFNRIGVEMPMSDEMLKLYF